MTSAPSGATLPSSSTPPIPPCIYQAYTTSISHTGGTSGAAIGAGSVPSSAVAFYNSCPLHVRARPRQSINITLYSFGHYLDHDDTDSTTGLRFCSANLFIAEGQRRHSSPLCPARQRQRNLYLSHDSILTLYFSQQPRKLLNSFNRWTFILKIECKSNMI